MGKRKSTHPIRLMRQAFHEHLAGAYFETDKPGERLLARHVKPLLDALEDAHQFCRDEGAEDKCGGCNLLAAWRAKC